MKNLYRSLNIPVSFLSQEFNKTKYSEHQHRLFDRSDISDEYLAWISSLGLKLSHAEIFFSLPSVSSSIHLDDNRHDFPKINWIFGDSTSCMNWYTPKDGVTGNKSWTKEVNTLYVGYKLEEVDLLHSVELISPSLIQAGIPHNSTTFTGSRWCVSTVYKSRNFKLLTFNEAVKILTPFMIN